VRGPANKHKWTHETAEADCHRARDIDGECMAESGQRFQNF
jgi:hypothetical protein